VVPGGGGLGRRAVPGAELVETFGVLVASVDGPPLAMGIHKHAMPARSCGATHGVPAPLRVLHHAEALARCRPGDVGDVADHCTRGSGRCWRNVTVSNIEGV
jgi:hypothetical protein